MKNLTKAFATLILGSLILLLLVLGIANSQDLDFIGTYSVKGNGRYTELNDPRNQFQFTNIKNGIDLSLDVQELNINGCVFNEWENYPQCEMTLVVNGGTFVKFNPPVFWNAKSGIFTGTGTLPCIVGPCYGTDPNLLYVINGTFNIKNNRVTKITGTLYVPYLEDNVFGYINYTYTATR